MGWAQFDLGGPGIAIERADPNDPEARELCGRFVGVSITVDNITATCDAWREKGVHFIAPPEVQPWGGVLAHFQDPAGNTLTLLGSFDDNAD